MNELSTQTSPYLLQHKDNPVHWRVWGDAAFAEAQRLNKPILLSIGYAACHWCHVMAHESFENPFTAEVLNALYVPIKLDREERPDLDAIYQQALALMGQQGGWPLTMFLTPDGQPFWGGTYFPPDSRWGRPGFVDALKAAERVWREDPEKALSNVHALRQGLARLSARADPAEITPEHLNEAALKILSYIDPVDGGVGRAPKFPQAPALNLLWRRYQKTGDVRLKEAVLLTLDKMSQGGIYDHLGGGYSRYATDDAWLVPHFEKMLYDNAQLIELLSYAFVETGSALYAERVAETIDWLLREMRVEGAGFAAALDADSEHEEGKFYVWTEAEVREVLGEDADLFCQAYDVRRTGNWEGKVILNRSENPERQNDETEARLAKARAKLLTRRSERVRPGRDHKVLADWNGLMISALCTAAQVFERPDWLEAAKSAYGFVRSHATAPDGALQHSWCDRQTHPALLDDYAAISRAALSLYQATGDRGYLGQAKLYVKTAEALFADTEHGGYFTTRAEAAHVIVRLRSAVDHATPAGNGVMLEVLASLFFLTGETAYADAARRLIAAFSGDATRQVLGSCSFLNGVGLLNEAVQITLVSGDGEAALIAALGRKLQPGWIVAWVEEPADLPAHHPAHYKTRIADQATVYICRGAVCSAPVTEADALAEALEMTSGA